MFYVLYFGTTATGVVWLYHLTTMYRSSTFATTRGRRYRETHTLPASETDGYSSSTINVDADAGDGYCIGNVPFMSWVMYAMMILSEFVSFVSGLLFSFSMWLVSFVSGLLFSFSMWRPICRGARYMNDFKPPIPKEQWPTVDIFVCHYMEPVTDSMQTLKNCLALQYPPELLHIFVLDDGCT